jgi:hypothetical protein
VVSTCKNYLHCRVQRVSLWGVRVPEQTWKVTGYDGPHTIYSGQVPGILTEDEIARVLQLLAARHLTHQEVVAASLPKNNVAYEPLLECHINRIAPKGTMVTVGINPHYVAFRERAP